MSVDPSTAITCFTYGAMVSVSCPVPQPEVADDERRIDQPEHRPEIELIAEEIASQPIPPASGRREKFL